MRGGGGGVFRERQQQLYDRDLRTLQVGERGKAIFFGRRRRRPIFVRFHIIIIIIIKRI